MVQIRNESRTGWPPTQSSLCLHARSVNVAANELPEPSEMGSCLLGRFGHDRHFQTAADGLSDIPEWHSLFSDRVIPGPCFLFLQRQPVEARSIEDMHGWPAVEPVAD